MSGSKKVHIGHHGKKRCQSRYSLHVSHRPPIVVSEDEFRKLPKELQCEKCAKLIDTTDFARGLSQFIGMTCDAK